MSKVALPPEDRKKLKKKAKAGATKRQLEVEVKKSREKHGAPKADKAQAKAGAKGAAAKAKSDAGVDMAKQMVPITNGTEVCNDYAGCLALLEEGKSIEEISFP